MRIKTFLIFMLMINFSFAQTKTETQDWIKEKIELFGYSNDVNIFNSYKLEFLENNLILTEKHKSYIGDITIEFQTVNTIPIKLLSKIRFEEKGSNLWLFIRIYNGDKSIKSKVDVENDYIYKSEIVVLLEKDFSADNLQNRMIKAFDHLIQLYGGKIISEKF